jgi:hypothetical protein
MKMENENICQSCGMPLDSNGICGTEKNGSINKQYCKYCYKDGAFTNPYLTMYGMKYNMRTEMKKRHISQGVIDNVIKTLPTLNRWRT